MKFLLDENMPPSLVGLLLSAGHEARHVIEIGYNNTPDFKITEFAATSGEVIITHDTDFGTILALTGKSRPSVILFRWQTITSLSVFQFFQQYLPKLTESLSNGALVVVDERKIRVRTLPLML
jgi:predicted nuclease of predicted toxin-antitoxin system